MFKHRAVQKTDQFAHCTMFWDGTGRIHYGATNKCVHWLSFENLKNNSVRKAKVYFASVHQCEMYQNLIIVQNFHKKTTQFKIFFLILLFSAKFPAFYEQN